MTSLYDLGLNFRDCQLIESYLNLERCELKYQRAVLVYDDLHKKFNTVEDGAVAVPAHHVEALEIGKARIKLAEEALAEAKKDFEKFVKEDRRDRDRNVNTKPLFL